MHRRVVKHHVDLARQHHRVIDAAGPMHLRIMVSLPVGDEGCF
jgi:hypothetical protein